MQLFDFMVLGGGPAGNQTALQLASAGYSVQVIDYRQTLGDKPCSGVVGIECVERYEIPESLIRSRCSTATFHAGSGRSFDLTLKDDGACVIDRVGYVQYLASEAMSAGAEYLLGATVRTLDVSDQDVRVTVKHESGIEEFSASAVVVATGFNSQIARNINLPSAGSAAFAAQAEIDCPDTESIEVYSGDPLPNGWFGWVVPIGNGKGLLGVLGRGSVGSPTDVYNKLADSLAHRFAAVDDSEIEIWGVPLKPAERTYSDRVVMVGDVAGQAKPTTGGGIYYSLRCADIAAEVLIDATRASDYSAARLAKYESEWKAILASELAIGYAARKAFETIPSRHFERLIHVASRNGFMSAGLQFDWHSTAINRGLKYAPFGTILRPVKRLLSAVL